jgi:hypothetical protein
MRRIKRKRTLLTVALLAASSTGALAVASPASALAACRSDPYVLLSNTAQLDLSASIGTSLSNVAQVTYVLHVPAGVQPLLTVNTDSLIGPKEHFAIYSDDAASQYDTYTTVTLVNGSTSVVASSWIVSLSSLGVPNVSGSSETAIHIHLGSSLLGL